MKVSIVVPIYNVRDYVKRCIESTLNQDYQNIEVILINDGSTDDSLEIINEVAQENENVFVYSQENQGLSSTRNRGVKVSTGDALFFLDSDDWIEPQTISTLVNNMVSENVDISICGINQITGEDIIKKGSTSKTILTGKEAIISYYYKKYDMEPMVWNKLYRRELFDRVLFEDGLIHEDKYFTPKILYYASEVCLVPYFGYNYVFERPGSITTSKLQRKNLSGLEANLSNKLFFEEKQEWKLARLASIKYSVDLSYYYCLYKFDGVKEIPEELHDISKKIFFKSAYMCLRELDIKSLLRITYFAVAKDKYYNSWIKKRG